MTYVGQPVPSTVANINAAKVSDGKSVRVTVPENTTIEAGKFYLLDGFLGCAFQSVTTGAGETAEVVLNIEPAEYETDQTKTNDRASMTVGEDIYWDKSNKYFTLSATDIYAGKITSAADENGVIWFKLAECPFSLDDVTTLAAQVGTLGDLTTTAKNSIVAAINEVDGEMGTLASLTTTAKNNVVAAINEVDGEMGTLASLTTTAKNNVVAAINEVNAKVAEKVDPIADVENLSVSDATDLQSVATKLNSLITALTAAGLMAAGE
jgi:hypothetical protein